MSGRRRLLVALIAALAAGAATAYWQIARYRRAEAQFAAAKAELSAHHYEAAYYYALAAAEYLPKRGDVRLLAARACRRFERPDEAKPHLDAAREALGETDDIRLELQLIPVQKGEATEFVEESLRQRADLDRENRALIFEALAAAQLSTFRIDLAKATIDAWLKEPNTDGRPHYWRGLALEQMGGYQEDAAIADYRRAVELDPDFDEARERLGRLLLKKKMIDEARTQFDALVSRHPNNAAALVGLARARLAQGETDAGRDLLERALKFDPNEVDGLRELGTLTRDAGRPAEALPLLRKACTLQPQDPYSSHALTLCLRNLGREAEALEEQKRYDDLAARQAKAQKLLADLQQKPKDANLLHELGTLYLGGGRAEYEQTGLWLLQRALQSEPGRADTIRALSNYFERKGRPEIARKVRQRMQ